MEPDRGDSKETETEATGTWLARAVLVLHLLLWIASIALVASLYGLHTPLPQPTYALAPLLDASASGDVVPLLALRARGLFADVSVAVACLVAQTAVYALVVPERRFAGFIVVATAILVLFMQEKWYLSFGGLLWSELVLAFTFFAVGTRARGAALPLSLPVLAVAALAAAGARDATALTAVYFSLCGTPLLWDLVFLLLPREGDDAWVLGLLAWLSVVPLYVQGGLVLAANSDAPVWAYAALVWVLVWVGLLLLGLGAWPQLSGAAQSALYALHQAGHAALVLLLLIGLFKS